MVVCSNKVEKSVVALVDLVFRVVLDWRQMAWESFVALIFAASIICVG